MNEFLLKLLPIDAFFPPYVWNNVLSLVLILIIIFYGIIEIFRFKWIIGRIEKEILDITQKLKELKKGFPDHFNQANEFFESSKLLRNIWKEYEPTLIKSQHPYRIYKADPAELYFNEESIISDRINIRYWQALPSILVGLGILGTFIGLTLGLSQFDLGSRELIEKSIKALMTGMTTAFSTSVWGMLLSIIFSWYEKKRFNNAKLIISRLNINIDKLFTLTSQEKIALQHQEQLEIQTTALKSFSTDLAEKIGIAMDTIMASRLSVVQQGLEKLYESGKSSSESIMRAIKDSGTDISRNLQQTVGNVMIEKLSPALDNVAMSVNTLIPIVESLRAEKQETAVDAIKTLAEEFKSALLSSTSKEMEQLNKQIGASSELLSRLPDQIEAMMKATDEQNAQIKKIMEDISASTKKEMEDRQEESKTFLNNMKNSIDNAVLSQQALISEVTDSFIGTTNKAIAELAKTTASIVEAQKDSHTSMESLLDATRNVLSQSNEFIEKAKDVTDSLVGVSESVSDVSEAVIATADTLKQNADTMQTVIEAFKEESQEHFKATRDALQHLTESMSKSDILLKAYTQNMSTFEDGLAHVFEEIEAGLTRYSTATKTNLGSLLSEFCDRTSMLTGSLGASIELFNSYVSELNERLEKIRLQ